MSKLTRGKSYAICIVLINKAEPLSSAPPYMALHSIGTVDVPSRSGIGARMELSKASVLSSPRFFS